MSIVTFDPFRTLRDFDRMADRMFAANQAPRGDFLPKRQFGQPAFDIEEHGEDTTIVSLAVPGFTKEQLEISLHEQVLTIKGDRKQEQPEHVKTVRKGIVNETFEHSFKLAEHIEIASADLDVGLLRIVLERRVPEALKPRTIEIGASSIAA